jgi:hypothetical protein
VRKRGGLLPDLTLFKKPVLPATVAFGSAPSGDEYVFSLTSPSNGAPHLLGRSTVPDRGGRARNAWSETQGWRTRQPRGIPHDGVRVAAVLPMVVGVSRSWKVAVAGSQTPTSPMPSSFQSPATGRLDGVPRETF